MTRLLVVDDEPQLLRALVLNLTNRDYDVTTASTAALALAQVRRLPPDLVILDLGLPDIDGIDVIRELREREPNLPIIVLTARSGSHDKITAMDLGAVDYVTKPFDMNELIARLRAALRRLGPQSSGPRVTLGTVEIDFGNRTARRTDGVDRVGVHFTPTEWRILDVLLRHPGRLVTTRELLTIVPGDPERAESGYLRLYLSQLRRKLEPVPGRPRHLLTEPGMGYRFQP